MYKVSLRLLNWGVLLHETLLILHDNCLWEYSVRNFNIFTRDGDDWLCWFDHKILFHVGMFHKSCHSKSECGAAFNHSIQYRRTKEE